MRESQLRRFAATTRACRLLPLMLLQSHPDDVEPAIEAVKRELTDLFARRAEGLPVWALLVRWGKGVGDGRQELVKLCADSLGESRISRCLAQVPDAVADVALLIVVDVAVAVDESRQQLV